VGGQHGAVARERQPQRFGQAVHRVGGKHSGAGTTGRAGGTLDVVDFLIGTVTVAGLDHGIDEIDGDGLAFPLHLASLHRAAGNEDGRNIEAQRSHQHARGDLVAVGDANHGVSAVAIDHVFDRIGDQVARGQRIEHAGVTHGDAVIDGDGVEFLGDTAGRFDLARHQLPQILEVHVPRHELGEGVHHGDDRLAEITILHAGSTPKGASAGHVAAVS